MVGWFSGVKSFMNASPIIEFEGLEKVHTDSCVSMAHLFENVTVKNNLNGISNWVTTNVTDMSYMFSLCKAGMLDLRT